MSVDESKIDLTVPYNEMDGQAAESENEEAVAAEATPPVVEAPKDSDTSSEAVAPQKDTENQEDTSSAQSSDEPSNTVSYKRFKKFHDEAKQARQEAEEWRTRYEQSLRYAPPQTETNTGDDELPASWIKLWGDNEVSREAWKAQQQLNDDIIAKAEARALQKFQDRETQEETHYKENLATLDENFTMLSDFLGRDLTPVEEDAVLDIIDEYTPKDNNGNFAGAMLPIDKAWEIYELKAQTAKAPKVAARNKVASLSGAGSQGETSISNDDDTFVPGDWGSWRRFVK